MEITRSIQEMENEYWPDLEDYPTGLIRRCHEYRKIPINELRIHQIITLLIQDIGSMYLIPIVVMKMEKDILEVDEYDGSSFFRSLEFFAKVIRNQDVDAFIKIIGIIRNSKEELIRTYEEDKLDSTLKKLLSIGPGNII